MGDINQKLIRLLETIMGGRKEYCGSHYVYTPQLNADSINEIHAELIALKGSTIEFGEIIEKINAKIEHIKSNEMYPAYCLNGQTDGLKQALDIINDFLASEQSDTTP